MQRTSFRRQRPLAKPAPAVVLVHDDAGKLIGRLEGAGVRWRCWRWCDDRGEYIALGGVLPGERAATAHLKRVVSR